MNLRNATLAAALLLAAVASGIGIDRALATGAPTQAPLTYAGTLTDQDGKPYASAQDVTLKLFDAASGGTQKCATGTVQAEANTGNFQVTLPPDCVQAVRDQSELWTELTVGAGKTVLPRTKLGAVPYALEADTAKVAGTAAAASGALKTQVEGIQAKVDGLAAGGGSGGPWLADGSGVKLGKFLGTTLTTFKPEIQYEICTSTGHLLQLGYSGVTQATLSDWSIYFTDLGCTGTSMVLANPAPSKYFAVKFGNDAYLVAPTTSDPFWKQIAVPYKSQLTSQGCKSAYSAGSPQAYEVKVLTAAQVGLPVEIKPGWQIMP